jgi:hypothetical protein
MTGPDDQLFTELEPPTGYRPFGFSWVLWLIGVGLLVACCLSLVLR